MVDLEVKNNLVILNPKVNRDFARFVNLFLTKYEEVSALDFYSSTKKKKRFRTVTELRNLYTVDDSDNICFSRGLLEYIPEYEYRIINKHEDSLIKLPSISKEEIKKSLDVYDLREDQIIAVNKCLYAKRGVIQLPTATGKSSIIASTIKLILKYNPAAKILVLAPTLSTVKNINDTFLKNNIDTHIYNHPNKNFDKSVTTSLVQSLVASKDPDILSGINAVFYDECLPANAKILISDGSLKTISEVYNNDSIKEVLSYNIETRDYEVKRILRKFKTPFNDRFWKVYYRHPVTDRVQGVTLTNNHKVYTKNRGYIQAQDLTSDDYIKVDCVVSRYHKQLDNATYVQVLKVTPNIGSIAEYKYNLEVEDNHNYFANNILVSNCHHLKCETWNKLNTMLRNVEYSLGFSALSINKEEIYKTDMRQLSYNASLIVGCSGRVLMHMDPSYYIEQGIIAQPVIFRIANSEQLVLPDGYDETSWHKVSKLGLMSATRTDKVAKIASIFSKHNRKVLILVSERDYAFYVGKFLKYYTNDSFGISFGAGAGFVTDSLGDYVQNDVTYKSKNTMDVINDLSKGDINILLGTTHLDEGVDISALDAVILASGGNTDRRVIQRIGRVLRKSKSGKYAYVIDFTDIGSQVLARQSRNRLKLYKESLGVTDNFLYNGLDLAMFEEKFKELENID